MRGKTLALARELAAAVQPTQPVPARGADAARAAKAAGLRYSDDARPGIRRLGKPPRFRYVGPRGRPIADPRVLGRIKRLAIPPAWTDVWINPDPRGHIQARGRDDRGRKQYRYHPEWQYVRDRTKFDGLIAFAQALPKLRRSVAETLRRRDEALDQSRVLAVVVRLLECSLIRIGNEEYARVNGSYGLTTLRDRHATIAGRTVRFSFAGKSGVRHEIELQDPTLARLVRQCQDLPGQLLFQYVDTAGVRRRLRSEDVNAFIREHMGDEFTAKDFRTWAATVLSAIELARQPPPTTKKLARQTIADAIRSVAEKLGNTAAVCRKSYVHPAILAGYTNGTLAQLPLPEHIELPEPARARLGPEEKVVLAYLRQAQRGEKRLASSPSRKNARRDDNG